MRPDPIGLQPAVWQFDQDPRLNPGSYVPVQVEKGVWAIWLPDSPILVDSCGRAARACLGCRNNHDTARREFWWLFFDRSQAYDHATMLNLARRHRDREGGFGEK
jgi:hypothetical protein